MTAQLFDAIASGTPGITLNISAKDLRDIVADMVCREQRRIAAETERGRELYTLTRKQAAEKLGVSTYTLARMAKDGRLTPSRVGIKPMYRETDILQYLERNKQNPTQL